MLKPTLLKLSLFLVALTAIANPAFAELSKNELASLTTLIDSDSRSERTRLRNQYRHPFETLKFFDVKSDPLLGLSVLEPVPARFSALVAG